MLKSMKSNLKLILMCNVAMVCVSILALISGVTYSTELVQTEADPPSTVNSPFSSSSEETNTFHSINPFTNWINIRGLNPETQIDSIRNTIIYLVESIDNGNLQALGSYEEIRNINHWWDSTKVVQDSIQMDELIVRGDRILDSLRTKFELERERTAVEKELQDLESEFDATNNRISNWRAERLNIVRFDSLNIQTLQARLINMPFSIALVSRLRKPSTMDDTTATALLRSESINTAIDLLGSNENENWIALQIHGPITLYFNFEERDRGTADIKDTYYHDIRRFFDNDEYQYFISRIDVYPFRLKIPEGGERDTTITDFEAASMPVVYTITDTGLQTVIGHEIESFSGHQFAEHSDALLYMQRLLASTEYINARTRDQIARFCRNFEEKDSEYETLVLALDDSLRQAELRILELDGRIGRKRAELSTIMTSLSEYDRLFDDQGRALLASPRDQQSMVHDLKIELPRGSRQSQLCDLAERTYRTTLTKVNRIRTDLTWQISQMSDGTEAPSRRSRQISYFPNITDFQVLYIAFLSDSASQFSSYAVDVGYKLLFTPQPALEINSTDSTVIQWSDSLCWRLLDNGYHSYRRRERDINRFRSEGWELPDTSQILGFSRAIENYRLIHDDGVFEQLEWPLSDEFFYITSTLQRIEAENNQGVFHYDFNEGTAILLPVGEAGYILLVKEIR